MALPIRHQMGAYLLYTPLAQYSDWPLRDEITSLWVYLVDLHLQLSLAECICDGRFWAMLPPRTLDNLSVSWEQVKKMLAAYANELLDHDYGAELMEPMTRMVMHRDGTSTLHLCRRLHVAAHDLELYIPSPLKGCQILNEEEYLWLICLNEAITHAHQLCKEAYTIGPHLPYDPITELIDEIAHARLLEEDWSTLPQPVTLHTHRHESTTPDSPGYETDISSVTDEWTLSYPEVSPF